MIEAKSSQGSMTRRELIRLGLSSAALSCLNSRCKSTTGGSKPDQPNPQPTPVYHLTDGKSLYDDFDGNGCLQSYDNRSLAEAGKVSSKIWQAWTGWGTADAVPNPVDGGLLTVVDEQGRRVEYGWQDRAVQEIVSYLVENPRPVTAFERDVLQRLLNDRGKAAVAGLEARELDIQVKVIQYLLNFRDELFNERGRALVAALSETESGGLAREGWLKLVNRGFDETELFVVSRLAAEKRLYDSLQNSAVRKAIRGGERILRAAVGWRTERQEIKYVFNSEGKLIDAVPHTPGAPYHGAQRLLWLGARNGSFRTRNGLQRIQKGRIYGLAQLLGMGGRGYVLKMTNSLTTGMSCNCCWPTEVEFADSKSFSADVLLSSQSTAQYHYAVLDYHTTIPEQFPGKSWATQIGIGTVQDETLHLIGQCVNVNTGYRYFKYLGEARLDRWYNLRFDFVTQRDDASLKAKELRVDFYVDGVLKASEIPEDSELLLDPTRTGVGPKRIISVNNEVENRTSIAFFDNIRAVYKNRVG